ncbi:MAG: hypothetical protein KTR26_11230 [Flammeovirgaceae bacterium]|nr:hypothetical protein [Flammeovirgaceae bacterium]
MKLTLLMVYSFLVMILMNCQNKNTEESEAEVKVVEAQEMIFEEIDGIVGVEAEHFISQTDTAVRKWYLTTTSNTPDVQPDLDGNHAETASNGAYLEILPDTRVTHDDSLIWATNFINDPGEMAILTYKVHFNNSGKYFVWVRANCHGTEDNGIHVGIDGTWPETGQRIQFWGNKKEWSWESRQRTDSVHTGVQELIYLEVDKPGLHTIHFSMREDGFEMDKWVMRKEYVAPEGTGPDERLRVMEH